MQQRPGKLRRAPEDTGSVTSSAETNGGTCQQGDISHDAQNTGEEASLETLPEDIVHHIHSLLFVQDAARAACVCRVFLSSWRCYSDLILDGHTLGLTDNNLDETQIKLVNKIDQILKNHYDNGVKVKILSLFLYRYKSINPSYLDRWLQISVKSGIEQFHLFLCPDIDENYYSFPCSVLSDEAAASSIQSLLLSCCAFHSTSTLGCLKRLKSLDLSMVHITEEGLGHLLSKSLALERLVVNRCIGIICLRIPCTLQQLKLLHIGTFDMAQAVQIDAPNLNTLYYTGDPLVEISFKNSSQLKNVSLKSYSTSPPGTLSYVLTSIAPNVESLSLRSFKENVDISMLPFKLIKLKKLEFRVCASVEALSPSYDVFSLACFLDASPVLEYFVLWVHKDALMHDPIVGDDERYPRRKPECRYNSLREVTISGFCSAKSLVELTIHILESAPSLQRLTLDTVPAYGRSSSCCASSEIRQCWPMSKTDLTKSLKAMRVASRYIARRVPTGVQYQMLEPCSRCHTDSMPGTH